MQARFTDDEGNAEARLSDATVLVPAFIAIAPDRPKATGRFDAIVYTLERGPATEAAAVTVTLAPPAGNDWGIPANRLSHDVSFGAGEASKTLRILLRSSGSGNVGFSATAAVGGTLVASLGDADGYDTTDTAEVEVVVTGNPSWIVKLTQSSYSFPEDGGAQTVTVEAYAASDDVPAPSLPLSATFATVDGTAGSPSDFAAVSTDVTIAPPAFSADPEGIQRGQAEVTFTPAPDSSEEGSETLSFRLGKPTGIPSGVVQYEAPGGTRDDSTADYPVTIIDDDDVTMPMLSTATVDGASLALTYNELLDEGSKPPPGAFTVSVDSGDGTAPSMVDVSGRTVTLTLADAVTDRQKVTVSYTVPTEAGTNPIRDGAQINAAALTDQAVTNNTPDNTEPMLESATVDGDSLELTYDEDLDENSVPPRDAFTVSVAGAARALAAIDPVDVSGKTVTLTLVSAVEHGQTVTLTYMVPTGADPKPIRDTAQINAAALTGQEVTNETPDTTPPKMPSTGTAVWSANMSVGEDPETDTAGYVGGVRGYGSLDDDNFNIDGTTYTVVRLYTNTSDNTLSFEVQVDGTGTDLPDSDDMTLKLERKNMAGQYWEFPLSQRAATNVGRGIYLTRGPASTTHTMLPSGHVSGETVAVELVSSAAVNVISTDAALSALALTEGTTPTAVSLTPVFSSTGTQYLARVASGVSQVSVTATKNDDGATVAISDDSDLSTPGEATVTLELDSNTITVTVTAADGGTTRTYTVTVVRGPGEMTVPELDAAAVDGTSLVLTYDEALATYSRPAASDFAVMAAGETRTVSDVVVSGSTVTLTLSSAVTAEEDVTVSYKVPATNRIRDLVGNDAGALTGRAVTNNTPPAITGIAPTSTPASKSVDTVPEPDVYGRGEEIRITVTFDVPVTVTGTPEYRLQLLDNSLAPEKVATLEEGDGTNALVFAYTVQEDDIGFVRLPDHATRLGSGDRIRGAANMVDADLSYLAGGPRRDHKVDGSRFPPGKPTISGTVAVGSTLTASPGTIEDPDGTGGASYSYQWLRVNADGSSNAVDIPGATSSTYTLTAADAGKRIRVEARFTDDEGNPEARLSDATVLVPAFIAIAPDRPKATGRFDAIVYTLERTGPTTAAATVTVTLEPPAGNDWGIPDNRLSHDVAFGVGEASKTLRIVLRSSGSGNVGFSATAATGGTLVASLGDAAGYDTTDTAEVEVVVTEDPSWIVRLTQSSYSFPEGGGAQTVTVEAYAASDDIPAPSVALGATFLTERGSATSPEDYAAVNSVVSIEPSAFGTDDDGIQRGQAAVTFTPVQDTEVEGHETLSFTLGRLAATPGGVVQVEGADGTRDDDSNSYPVTILGDDNTPPVFADDTATREVAENTAADADVGEVVTATDADNHTLAYSLEGTDAESFAINASSGRIKTKAALDHEAKATYSLTVVADDAHGGTDTIEVTIDVTDADEQSATPAAPTVETPADTVDELAVSWTEPGLNEGPDITGYAVQYREDGSEQWLDWTHTGTDTSATLTGLRPVNKLYQVRVRALNGETASDWSDSGSGRTGLPANAGPLPTGATEIWSAMLTVGVSGSTIGFSDGSYGTLSPDNFDIHGTTYTVKRLTKNTGSVFSMRIQSGGVDADLPGHQALHLALEIEGVSDTYWTFSLADDTSADVGFYGAEAFGSGYPVFASGHDGGETAAVKLVTTRSGNNAAPVFAAETATRAVAENTAAKADVGAAVAAADDDGDPLTYTLEGTDAGSFAIDSSSGRIKTKAALDHESKTSYSVTVKADDRLGGTDTIAVTINVTDVEEKTRKPARPTVEAPADSVTSLNVGWTGPGLNGGPEITGYEVQYLPPGTEDEVEDEDWLDWAHTGTDTSTTITSLTERTAYKVRVRALNGEMPSDWSDEGSGSTGTLPPNAIGEPEITGTAAQDSKLTASPGTIEDPEGLIGASYSYQWIRVDEDGTSNAVEIPGATSDTYTLTAADAGKRIKVKASFTDDRRTPEARTSDAYPAKGTVRGPAIAIAPNRAKATGLFDAIVYTLERTGPTTAAAAVTVTLEPPAGNDWGISASNLSHDVAFGAGEASKQLFISLRSSGGATVGFSATATTSGTLVASLGAVTGYDTTDTAEVEVVVTEGPSWIVRLTQSSYSVREDGGAQTVTIEAYAASADIPAPSLPLSATFATVDGTAGSPVDFAAVTEVVSVLTPAFSADDDGIQRGQATITFTPAQDSASEGSETLSFRLGKPTAIPSGVVQYEAPDGTRSDSTADYPVTIIDDDDTTPPMLSTATVDGASLELTYNELLDEGSKPPPGAFTVSVDSGDRHGAVQGGRERQDGDADAGRCGDRPPDGDGELHGADGGGDEPHPRRGAAPGRGAGRRDGDEQHAGQNGAGARERDGERRLAGADLRRGPGRELGAAAGRVHGECGGRGACAGRGRPGGR